MPHRYLDVHLDTEFLLEMLATATAAVWDGDDGAPITRSDFADDWVAPRFDLKDDDVDALLGGSNGGVIGWIDRHDEQ